MSPRGRTVLVPLRFLVLCALLAGCLAPSQAAIPPVPVARTAAPAPALNWGPDSTPLVTPELSPSLGATTHFVGVTAIGDSIMVDATPNLRATFPGISIDALAGRQVVTGIGIMQAMASSGRLGRTVVIGLGTNGAISSAQLDRILTLAAGREVVMLTNYCPHCDWIAANNQLMRTGCTGSRNCLIADWHGLAAAHPAWFTDGVHTPIGGVGGQAYANLVAQTLQLGPPVGPVRMSPVSARSAAIRV